jgi:hypothetical protein
MFSNFVFSGARVFSMDKKINTIFTTGYRVYPDDFLVTHLKELTAQLNRAVGKHDIERAGQVPYAVYHKRFGSLLAARKAAGLVKTRKAARFSKNGKVRYTDKYLLHYLKKLSKQLGRIPWPADVRKENKINYKTYTNRFGSFKKALEAAGMKVIYADRIKYTGSGKFLLAHLKELTTQLNRAVGKHDIDRAGKVPYAVYKKHFGNLLVARRAAGLVKPNPNEKYTDIYLLNYLKELAATLGRTPGARDLGKEGKITYQVYIQRFGSFKKAVEAAGLKVTYRDSEKYSKEELITHLQKLAKQLGRSPGQKDLKQAGDPNYGYYRTRFGSFKHALVLAGLPVKEREKNSTAQLKAYLQRIVK